MLIADELPAGLLSVRPSMVTPLTLTLKLAVTPALTIVSLADRVRASTPLWAPSTITGLVSVVDSL